MGEFEGAVPNFPVGASLVRGIEGRFSDKHEVGDNSEGPDIYFERVSSLHVITGSGSRRRGGEEISLKLSSLICLAEMD